jgi:hypothetical protein
MRSRLIASSSILALAAAGTFALAPADATTSSARAGAKPQPTAFALGATGYGTRVRGGQVPAGSGSTAYEEIGCTNNAGVRHENHELKEELPGVGTASQVATTVWTQQKNGVVSSKSRSTIARIALADSPAGSVTLEGIKSVSTAYHDSSGFHAVTSSSVASITLTDPSGATTPIDVPTPGQPADIPGVATITVGSSVRHASADGARAVGDAILIRSAASGSRAKIAHTVAHIDGGIKSGIFGGFAAGSQATGLGGGASSGRTPYQPMPCQGTDGDVQTSALSSADLGGQAVVSGLEDRQLGKQTKERSSGFEQARVAKIDFGDGQLVVKGIKGRVEVIRSGANLGKVERHAEGSIGSITANGETMEFPDTDTLEIPGGVLRLKRDIVHKIRGGIEITALRITVLKGTSAGAVIELGQARLRIHKSGR